MYVFCLSHWTPWSQEINAHRSIGEVSMFALEHTYWYQYFNNILSRGLHLAPVAPEEDAYPQGYQNWSYVISDVFEMFNSYLNF